MFVKARYDRSIFTSPHILCIIIFQLFCNLQGYRAFCTVLLSRFSNDTWWDNIEILKLNILELIRANINFLMLCFPNICNFVLCLINKSIVIILWHNLNLFPCSSSSFQVVTKNKLDSQSLMQIRGLYIINIEPRRCGHSKFTMQVLIVLRCNNYANTEIDAKDWSHDFVCPFSPVVGSIAPLEVFSSCTMDNIIAYRHRRPVLLLLIKRLPSFVSYFD